MKTVSKWLDLVFLALRGSVETNSDFGMNTNTE